MIIAMFALTVFLIGGVLGLRFKVFVLVAPIIVGIAAIFIIGLAFGSSAGFTLFIIFLGITALQMGYVAGAVIGCFAVKPRAEKESPNIVAVAPRLYRRSQG
ncbi:MAG TPA: hypothetical protein VLU23_20340 [Pseudolabrys sp.]|jgi:hypothetical protein|nr:hypothetical protein [Pseudolabrys sp.]